jgi:hypothetical protein
MFGDVNFRPGGRARWDAKREEYDVRVEMNRGDGGFLVGAITPSSEPGKWAAYRYKDGDADPWTPRAWLGNYSSPTAAAVAIAR